MADNTATDDTTPSAISAALESNLALQSELRSRLADVRRMQGQNRQDAVAVLSSLSRTWGTDPDTSMATISLEKDIEIPLNFCTNLAYASCINESKFCNRSWAEGEVKQLQNAVSEPREEKEKQSLPEHETLFGETALKYSLPSRSAGRCDAASFNLASPTILTSKITKKESRFIHDQISELGSDRDVDWLEIASKLNDKLYPNKTHRRTPWQCFKHYQSNLKKTALPWSSVEDELFIKYLAAHGSQFVLQGDGLARTNSNMFPFRNPNKIAIRSHSTLLNPNNVQDWWGKDEERKLALLMRAYSDETLPLKQASQSGHFPHRAQGLVSVKWNRSICPEMQRKRRDEEQHHKEAR